MTVTLNFCREQLLYDIANYAYIEGHRLETLSGCPEAAHIITDITAEGNIDRVNRILAAVHAHTIEMLRQLTYTPCIAETIDDTLWTPDVYSIELHMPAGMSRTTVHLLARLIHEYMVYMVIADWLMTVSGDMHKAWSDRGAQTAAAISAAYHGGSGTLTRRSSPW